MKNTPTSARRVLIVDDSLILRARIREIALDAGWEVVAEAKDGEMAVAFYREFQPALVTMDIVMPNVDGVEALRRIREMDSLARICMVSALNQSDKLAECIRLGAIDFIVKPFDKEQLKQFFEKQGGLV